MSVHDQPTPCPFKRATADDVLHVLTTYRLANPDGWMTIRDILLAGNFMARPTGTSQYDWVQVCLNDLAAKRYVERQGRGGNIPYQWRANLPQAED